MTKRTLEIFGVISGFLAIVLWKVYKVLDSHTHSIIEANACVNWCAIENHQNLVHAAYLGYNIFAGVFLLLTVIYVYKMSKELYGNV